MKINANGTEIEIIRNDFVAEDYISLTDIAKYKNPDDANGVIGNWLRSRNTIEFLGLWESLNNPNFKPLEFEGFRIESGSNAFTLSPQKWISTTSAIGMTSKSGRYGGTYAHKDIAFEFASWISPEFKLYIIKDYQRLKENEADKLALGWDTKRELSKINYKIHTDAIDEYIITPELTKQEKGITYASEADVLNVAVFGKTAKQWRNEAGNKKNNMRDFASVEQLIVLVNLESMNAELIKQGMSQSNRLELLRKMAYDQLQAITGNKATQRLANKTTSLPKK